MTARASVIKAVILILIVVLSGSSGFAQKPKKGGALKNVELCNGSDRVLPEARIDGCTAFIDAGEGTANGFAVAHNNRGNAYSAKTDYERAIKDFAEATRLNPNYAKAFNNLGVAYLRKGAHDLALGAFEEALRLNPNYGAAFANRAAAYLKSNAYERAAQDYDEAIRLDPNLEAVWSGRCWARAVLGALQAALDDCDRALRSETNAATYDSRALINLKMGQLSAAIDDYNSALRFAPKLASALYGRGVAKLRLGDKGGGDSDISAARRIDAGIREDFARYGVPSND
ncbi:MULTISPECIES: tetratricopeptide repeat protein [unclassified Bradyrhizobium]|uniref:tetratricopeptide repeat protein n=1 Tax=unclassified Bradyrhizobium TaxID=2631580 RepID=UPI001FF6D118|nr:MULTISPECIES: tetratricopeptide repeat protein [unclassified Bradyrhizobium]MCJ9701337.1 tetratricopeptide repeat protein [Bradyrhizobium sp. SHOUNA76]MCJ9730697.1 tetratricopeptide repeat protein [Bradyrhizobium sp. PRIMUS42]